MKLANINVGIKIDNSDAVSNLLRELCVDIITIQEIVRHMDDGVEDQYRSKSRIEEILGDTYPYSFFGPLWITDAFKVNGSIHRAFGGMIEQGNEVISKFPIIEATNEHYYKNYKYAQDWTNWKKEDHARALQVVEFDVQGKTLQVLNLHGIWTEDKIGDERTLEQCRHVVAAAKRKDIPTIIVGDFNLLPNTASMALIKSEFRDLINEYGIISTRPDFDDGTDRGNMIVDYIFVNQGIKVNDFHVIQTDVSDHLPLLLDFDL